MIQKKPKFLIDVGVGKKVEEWMKTLQYDTKTIRDIDPRMPDIEILKIANKFSVYKNNKLRIKNPELKK